MSLSIIGECRVNGAQGTVTIEGDTAGEVQSTLAKQAALQAATGRLSKPGLSSTSGPYPVNADGAPVEPFDADGRPQGIPRGAKFRNDYVIQAGL